MAKARILIIDDEESPREALRFILKDRYEVVLKESGASGLEAFRDNGPFDGVLLDMKMPDMSGLEVLEKILQQSPAAKVVMATAITDAQPAVRAMKMGAADYLSKPFDVNEIRLVVDRIVREKSQRIEAIATSAAPPVAAGFENIIGSSTSMRDVYALIQRLMDTESTVLVHGETGTGKELVARALHFHSARKAGPFMPVHCAAIPSELLESELFGHEKGSFTGAFQQRIGMFEAAGGGTLFLDEIGEMALGTQAKLLRAIQEREIRRVGGQQTISINVRIVCATNRNLEQEVKTGGFREDLFYRINVVPITLPPLRQRQDDIPVLIAHFVAKFAREFNRTLPQFSPEAMESLVNYAWPGNVRELEHCVERMMVTCDADTILPEHLPFVISQFDPATATAGPRMSASLPRTELGEKLEFENGILDLPKLTDDLERKAIEQALGRTDGVMTEAARSLNITRRMLRYKMDKLGILARHRDEGAEHEEHEEVSAEAQPSAPAAVPADVQN